MNKEYKITELFGSYQLEIDNNKLFYDVDKDIVNIIQTLQQENEKLNHYKLLYQKVKERNDKAIEYIEELYDNTDDITCYDIDRNTRDDLLVILKGNNEVSDDNN